MNLQLVKTENFNDITCDFYSAEDDIWMTRKQIGEALEYSDPQKAIDNLHNRYRDRLDKYSVTLKLGGLLITRSMILHFIVNVA